MHNKIKEVRDYITTLLKEEKNFLASDNCIKNIFIDTYDENGYYEWYMEIYFKDDVLIHKYNNYACLGIEYDSNKLESHFKGSIYNWNEDKEENGTYYYLPDADLANVKMIYSDYFKKQFHIDYNKLKEKIVIPQNQSTT